MIFPEGQRKKLPGTRRDESGGIKKEKKEKRNEKKRKRKQRNSVSLGNALFLNLALLIGEFSRSEL